MTLSVQSIFSLRVVTATDNRLIHKGLLGVAGGAKVLGKLPVPECPTILITVGQGPTALAVGVGGGCWIIFVKPKTTNQPTNKGLFLERKYVVLNFCLINPFQPSIF